MTTKNEVAEAKTTAVGAALNFAADAGLGLEGADKDSLAIPFLSILQPMSPQVVDETVEGAKAGLLINSITNDLYKTVQVVPVAFQRRFLRWALREIGGGYRGEYTAAQVEALKIERNDEGRLIYEGDELRDTRNHFVMIVTENGFQPALFSLSSTQIKKSKRWLSRIQGVQMKDANGRTFNPPSFSHVYEVRSVKESNDKGSWYGVEVDMVGPVADADLYAAARAFHDQIVSGKVEVATPVEEEKF